MSNTVPLDSDYGPRLIVNSFNTNVRTVALPPKRAQHDGFLIVVAVGGGVAVFAEMDEPMSGVPVFDRVQAFVV